MKKVYSVLLATFGIAVSIGSTSFAKEALTKENFDYDWYLEQHPDVAEILGTDYDAVWNFYETLGEPAGWVGRPSLTYFLTSQYRSEEDKTAIVKMYQVVETEANASMNQIQKAEAIHDWLCNNTDYDYHFGETSYSYVGTMLYGQSVCQGYTEAYDFMMQLCGIPCEVIHGTADNGSGQGQQGHAWNKLTIDGNVCYVDVTWDDFTNNHNYVAHDCFMISEEEMNRIHDGCVYLFKNGQPVGYVKR